MKTHRRPNLQHRLTWNGTVWSASQADYLGETISRVYLCSKNKIPGKILNLNVSNSVYLEYFTLTTLQLSVYFLQQVHFFSFTFKLNCKAPPPFPIPHLVPSRTSSECSYTWGTILAEHPGADRRRQVSAVYTCTRQSSEPALYTHNNPDRKLDTVCTSNH